MTTTTITIDRELLDQALEVIVANTVGAEDIEDAIRAALTAPATTPTQPPGKPEWWRELLRQSYDNCLRNFGASTMGSWVYADLEELFSAAQLAQPEQPSWQDAPTCEGMWLCDEGDENPYRFTCHDISMPLNPYLVGEGERWYGPIPEDKP